MTSYSTMKAAMAAIVAAGSIGVAATAGRSAAMAAEQQSGPDDASEYAKLTGGKLGLPAWHGLSARACACNSNISLPAAE